ncbi:hypothetical protein [uncultured Sphingomonas sp.]|uniref:hypothetical protein n=1 Tax=uncultured Sphingomonas sp. TaxID=158754 RepID=UPI0025D0871F|nr:hypothetical protein [uncultured Sphingomonas sp.]
MRKLIATSAAGLAIAASMLAVAAPSEARPYYRHHRGGGNDAAIALGAGVLGLAAGAAIASRPGYDTYYDAPGYYAAPPPVYYAPPPPPPVAYGYGYYGAPRYGYYGGYGRGYGGPRHYRPYRGW